MSQMTEAALKRARDLADIHVEQKECTCDQYDWNCAYRDTKHDFVRGYQAGMQDQDANSPAIVDHVALYERIGRALKDTGVPLTTHEMADARNVIRLFNKQKELLDECENVLLIAWGQLEAGCKEAEQVDKMIEKIREARK